MASSRIEDWKPHLGRKVSLRYKLHDGDHPYTEAIGVVSSVAVDATAAQTISILTRSGDTKIVASGDILASKLFPV